MQRSSFTLNEDTVYIDTSHQHLSAAEYIRQFTSCKSIKLGCNEGGCGACAVELIQRDAVTGKEEVVAVNSCLLPVAALADCQVITSEGLGNSRQGFNEVQIRLSGFHGTQCGFCSAGMAVSCHAALTAAAAAVEDHRTNDSCTITSSIPSEHYQRMNEGEKEHGVAGNDLHNQTAAADGQVCVDQTAGSSSSSSSNVACAPLAAELLSSLDGNLCRCTGWRPIADMVKSFCCDVDMEDLGLNTLRSTQLKPITHQQQITPAARKQIRQQQQQVNSQQQQQQQQQQFHLSLLHLQPGVVLVPRSLQQLLAAVQSAQAAAIPVHFLAGNTGSGLYKQQWAAVRDCVVVMVRYVPELQQLKVVGAAATSSGSGSSSSSGSRTGPSSLVSNSLNDTDLDRSPTTKSLHILAGSGVTISRLLRTLKDLAAAAAASSTPGRQQQQRVCAVSLQFLISHMSRIAGTLVRNAATLGGHLMLVNQQQLESDLITIMVAAGAEVEITDIKGTAVWITVEQFVDIGSSSTPNSSSTAAAAAAVSQLGSSALITAVRLPLPLAASSSSSSRPVMWSHKLTVHRHGNEHAAVNISMWLSKGFGRQAAAALAANGQEDSFNSSDYCLRIAIGTYQARSGNSSSSEGVWRCIRATRAEAAVLSALQQQQQQQQSGDDVSPDVLCNVLRDVPSLLSSDIRPAGRTAANVRSVTPALVLKGLSVILPVTSQQQEFSTAAAAGGRCVSQVTPALLSELRAAALAALPSSSSSSSSSDSSSPSPYPRSHQDLPVDVTTAPPLYWPAVKDGSILQCSGEAMYTDDTPVTTGALYGAYVTSQQAHASVTDVQWHEATYVAGVVGHVCAADIPAGPDCDVSGVSSLWGGEAEPLFADKVVQYVGQPLGLVLATTAAAAREGAARVTATYAAAAAAAVGVAPTEGAVNIGNHALSSVEKHQDHSVSNATASVSNACDQQSLLRNGCDVLDHKCDVHDDDESSLAPAITSFEAAVAADSWHEVPPMFAEKMKAKAGDFTSSLSECAVVLSGELAITSQRHFYLEPQTAVATPEEAGRMTVVSSCQGTDQVLHAVCRVLGVRHNQVHATCNRVGGGFGGKADRAIYPAAAAAVAAHKFRRQVRLVVDGGVDGCMTAGRCPIRVTWTAGVDEQNALRALKLDIILLAGAYLSTAFVEMSCIAHNIESVYNIPALDVNVRVAKANLPPRTTVRGPGKVSSTLIIETVLQQVAAAAGQSPELFRERLMMKIPQQVLEQAAAAAAAEKEEEEEGEAAAVTERDRSSPDGHDVGQLTEGTDSQSAAGGIPAPAQGKLIPQQQQQVCDSNGSSATSCNGHCNDSRSSSVLSIPHPKYYPGSSGAAAAAVDEDDAQAAHTITTTLNKSIALHTYTLPYMWQQLQLKCDYRRRRSAVAEFNRHHRTRKRGLALVPVRFETFQTKRLATVTLYSDGSVLLMHAGTEMGQGIGTKVKQTAAACLGALLPSGQAGLLLDYIRIATASTELMPHSGLAAASTTSEAATAAIAAACDILLERLTPAADKIKAAAAAAAADSHSDDSTASDGAALWEKIVREVAEPSPIMVSRVVMTATALAGFADGPAAVFNYQSFGVCAAEVEVDCCTGERQLLRADLMFDAGRTISPAVDLGQVEGAFMMGVGHVLHEEVIEDEQTGRNVTNTTWQYKPPGIAELPREFNVHMLRDSPIHVPTRRQLSAKATGEPPMLMAAAVACALQDAVAAAWDDHEQQQQTGAINTAARTRERPTKLQLPATTVNLQRALPPMWWDQ